MGSPLAHAGGRPLRPGTPGPTLHPPALETPLTFNLLRSKLDLKGNRRDSQRLAQRAGRPRPRPLGLPNLTPPDHAEVKAPAPLPSTLTPSCLFTLPDLST